MRIVIDARGKARPELGRVSGVAQYVSHITEALLALEPTSFTVLDDDRSSLPVVGRHLLFARRVDALKADLFFSPTGLLPLGLKTPAVAFIHDLFILDHPEWFPDSWWQRFFTLKIVLPMTVKKAKWLIVPSESVKQDVIRWFPFAAEKVSVIAEGVAAPTSIAPGRPGRYILSIATIDPRKNLLTAVRAFARSEFDGEFVIVGSGGWKNSTEVQEIQKTKRVVLLQNVTEAEKWSLYAGAELYLQTSLAEGFGLPPFEAMALGTPVVSTLVGALPELALNAVAVIPADDPEMIGKTLQELLEDERKRQDLGAWGKKAVEGLTWQAAAQKTLEVFTRFC